MKFENARFNMIEQQVRPWEVLDPRVLDVMGTLPREEFVAAQHRNLAYVDAGIPIDEHQEVMMHPTVAGRMLQALDVQTNDVILLVGTGSGYLTACLAKLGAHVHSVDINPQFTAAADKRLQGIGVSNVTLHTGDASNGWDTLPQYDVIAITGSMAEIPEVYKKSLSVGGRLFAVTGEAPVMTAHLVTRVSENEWAQKELFETCIPPLVNAEKPKEFVF